MLRTAARAAAVAALTTGALVAATTSASASAQGSAGIGSFEYVSSQRVTVGVPWGCRMTHTLIGYQRTVNEQYVDVSCFGIAAMRSGLFCGATAVFTTYDTEGDLTSRSQAPAVASCRTSGLRFYNDQAPTVLASGGTACASFVVGGRSRARVCHAITG